MNALRTAVLSLSVCVLAACAGHQSKSAYVAPADPSLPATLSKHQIEGMDRDNAYVSAVERLALRRGIEVKWVNPPDRRRLADTEQR
ncbi:hypothetical protein [Lysobacter enzymogenes]|jgi:hypothetical protein|uniref:Lipoprotein n=1 Tax=Lysobacter enzymogenes TaxID=69 RepID=A0AAU9AYX5_LYSEN|nr:hypothetical protein [Lysobacter enzymogenes]BAV98956.1 conserved hypothetical protein [Lysobacter enzymogenes]